MNFFTELAAYGQGLDIKLHIKEKNGKFTVSLQPQQADAAKLRPLILVGTAVELDEGFLTHASGALEATKGLSSNLGEVEKEAEAAAASAKSKPAISSSVSKSSLNKKDDKIKKKGSKPKAPVKPAAPSSPVDMFDQPAVPEITAENENDEEIADDQAENMTETE